MFHVETLSEGIIEISYKGIFTVQDWRKYQEMLLELLDNSDQQLYILSNFYEVAAFDKEVMSEAGTAKHLTHPRLGLIILLGGNVLTNFILQITQNRAQRESRSDKMRVLNDRARALHTLEHYRMIHLQAKANATSSATDADSPPDTEAP